MLSVTKTLYEPRKPVAYTPSMIEKWKEA